MASGNAKRAYHSTLAAATVDTVTLSEAPGRVEVVNRSGSAEIYYTLDGTVPTVSGADCYVVPASITSDDRVNYQARFNVLQVKLISSGTPTYSVQSIDNELT